MGNRKSSSSGITKYILLFIAVAIAGYFYFNIPDEPSDEYSHNPGVEFFKKHEESLNERQSNQEQNLNKQTIPAEVISAREAYLKAYKSYTVLVTEGGDGDVGVLLNEYKETYAHYQSLLKIFGVDDKDVEHATSSDFYDLDGIDGIVDIDDTSSSGSAFEEIIIPENTGRKISPQAIAHSSGAKAHLPERLVNDIGMVTWREIPMTPEDQKLDLSMPILQMDNLDNFIVVGKTTVDLPAGPNGKVVMIKGSMDYWISIPAEEIKLSNGSRGFRVVVDSESGPWKFAVSSNAAFGQLPEDVLLSKLITFEQKLITNKASAIDYYNDFQKEEGTLGFIYERLMKDIGNNRDALFTTFPKVYSSTLSFQNGTNQGAKYMAVKLYMDFGLIKASINKSPREAWSMYKYALERLAYLRSPTMKQFHGATFYNGTPNPAVPYYNIKKLVDDLGKQYAPWGVELTQNIINYLPTASGRTDDPLFDIRVLIPYGQVKYTDIKIDMSQVPEAIKKQLQEAASIYTPESTSTSVGLRLWSFRTVNMDFMHWLLNLTDEWILRWGPVVSGFASAYMTGGATWVYAGINLAWAVYQSQADEYLTSIKATESMHTHHQTFTSYAGESAAAATDVFFMGGKGQIMIGKTDFSTTPAQLKGSLAKLIVSASVAYFLKEYKDGFCKELSSLSDRQGYGGYNIPPVMVYGRIFGIKNQGPFQTNMYPITSGITYAYYMDQDRLYTNDLPEMIGYNELGDKFIQRTGGIQDVKRFPKDFPFKQWRSQESLEGMVHDYAPDIQLIRYGLTKNFIEERSSALGLDEAWDKVSLDDLEIKFYIQTVDATVVRSVPIQEDIQGKDLRKGIRYGIIKIQKDKVIAFPRTLPKGYDYVQDRKENIDLKQTHKNYKIGIVDENTSPSYRLLSELNTISIDKKNGCIYDLSHHKGYAGEMIKYTRVLFDAGVIRNKTSENLQFAGDIELELKSKLKDWDITNRSYGVGYLFTHKKHKQTVDVYPYSKGDDQRHIPDWVKEKNNHIVVNEHSEILFDGQKTDHYIFIGYEENEEIFMPGSKPDKLKIESVYGVYREKLYFNIPDFYRTIEIEIEGSSFVDSNNPDKVKGELSTMREEVSDLLDAFHFILISPVN